MSEFKFEGENYRQHSNLNGKDLLKVIRQHIKKEFPQFKFRINKQNGVYTSSFNFHIMSGPIEFLTESGKKSCWKETYNRQVNQYWIKDPNHENETYTPEGREMLIKLTQIISSYNMDDSDIQTDYFHTNFYSHIEIGHWEKEYTVIKK